jgi:transcriptional regulator with XRE-family HTH domain
MKTDPILLALGKNISDLRKEKGLTQEQLAERSGLDSTYISGIERGVRNPSFKSLVSLASGFGISVSEVCSGFQTLTSYKKN